MENVFKYAMVSLIVLPMLLMIVVAAFSAILIIFDLPFRD